MQSLEEVLKGSLVQLLLGCGVISVKVKCSYREPSRKGRSYRDALR